jgi:hypothetical protein
MIVGAAMKMNRKRNSAKDALSPEGRSMAERVRLIESSRQNS